MVFFYERFLMLGILLNPSFSQAASQPATESSATLPLLAPLGIQNSLGTACGLEIDLGVKGNGGFPSHRGTPKFLEGFSMK
jgi:hypothetical protein